MFETTQEVSSNDNRSENVRTPSESLSLPLIPAKQGSRGQVPSSKDFSKKQKLFLPNIKENKDPENRKRQDDNERSQNSQEKHKNTFALEVEEKLKKVLGGMLKSERREPGQTSAEEEFDFQAQIHRNKEIIRKEKTKKESQKRSEKEKSISKPFKLQKSRNQSLYQKRAREYRDQSIENKYLSKKKKNVKDTAAVNKAVSSSSRDIQPNNEYYARAPSKKHQDKKQINRAISQKDLVQVNRSANLFDGIQNFLENPKASKKQSKEELIGLSLLKAKRDLEDKIKAINSKLGTAQEYKSDTFTNLRPQPVSDINKEWRRIEFKAQQIHCHQSNFEKELDKISTLQERNGQSLGHYLEHQKILMSLQVHRKEMGKRKQINSQ